VTASSAIKFKKRKTTESRCRAVLSAWRSVSRIIGQRLRFAGDFVSGSALGGSARSARMLRLMLGNFSRLGARSPATQF